MSLTFLNRITKLKLTQFWIILKFPHWYQLLGSLFWVTLIGIVTEAHFFGRQIWSAKSYCFHSRLKRRRREFSPVFVVFSVSRFNSKDETFWPHCSHNVRAFTKLIWWPLLTWKFKVIKDIWFFTRTTNCLMSQLVPTFFLPKLTAAAWKILAPSQSFQRQFDLN